MATLLFRLRHVPDDEAEEVRALLDEHGIVDEDAVRDYADDLVARKPHYAAKLRPAGAPAAAVRSDDPIPTPGTAIAWQDIFGGRAG